MTTHTTLEPAACRATDVVLQKNCSCRSRCGSYQGHLVALVIAPPCGQNPGLVAIADSSPTLEGGMLDSGTLWISILACRPKVKPCC